jgi:hypothetical protein
VTAQRTMVLLWTTPPSIGSHQMTRLCYWSYFGGIGTSLAAVLQAGIKVQRYVYVDTDDAARQVAKQHSRGLRVRFPELLTTIAILSAFSSLTGDISLISEKDLHWLGHVDLVIAG